MPARQVEMETQVALHGRQARCPDHEQTEQDHDRAADEVEFVAPLQQRLGLSPVCLRTHLDAPLTHDNLYSSVLTLLDVRSPSYNRALDLFAACRRE